jgi:ribosome recycling factor
MNFQAKLAQVDKLLFQERRKEMAKLVSKLGEDGKIAIR